MSYGPSQDTLAALCVTMTLLIAYQCEFYFNKKHWQVWWMGLGFGQIWKEEREGEGDLQGREEVTIDLCYAYNTKQHLKRLSAWCSVSSMESQSPLPLVELAFLFAFLNEETEANEAGYSAQDT